MRRAYLTFALVCACRGAHPASPRPPGEYPGTLVPTQALGEDFIARQRVTARHGSREFSFEAALQKRGDALTLLGLTPFGTRAFVLQQRGVEMEFTSSLPEPLPFPPRYILIDIHRVFFIRVAPGPLPDGTHTAVRDGEEVREEWAGGRLQARHFRRLDGRPPGTIDIQYEGALDAATSARRVEFHNRWFGYTLQIETHSREAL